MSGLIAALPLFVSLIPRYELTGAGIALLISTILRLALSFICFPLFLEMRMPRCWISWNDVGDIRSRIADLHASRPAGII
jgi:O-antigen/teichoic acid export membrane protein